MIRKRYHSRQVMDASGLSVGVRYAFAAADGGRSAEASFRVMAGVVSNAVGLASSRGWDILARAGAGVKIPLSALFDDDFGADSVTVHPDGWYGYEDARAHPTLVYWANGHQVSWDHLDTFLGPQPRLEAGRTAGGTSAHDRRARRDPRAVVPEKHWLADPNLHAAGCAAGPAEIEQPADFERRMRAKRDEAMRRLFGP